MRAKYIEEEFPERFNYGGKTQIAFNTDREDEVDKLDKFVIEEHNRCIEKLVEVVLARHDTNPKEFDKYRY